MPSLPGIHLESQLCAGKPTSLFEAILEAFHNDKFEDH
jgi:hypothetical protein